MGVMKRSSYIGALERLRMVSSRCRGSSSARSVLDVFIADQCENRALGDDEIGVTLERDLDGGFAEKQRVVASAGLHWNESGFPQRSSPRLVAALSGIWHGQAGPGCDDVAALHSLAVDGSGRKVEADFRALLAFLDANQDAVA